MLKWGILSTAKIGIEHLIPAILKSSNGIVHAIASRSQDRANEIAQQFNIPTAYSTYEDLLADPEIDAIYIPLLTSQHVEWSIKAADAGKHVLCEKPIALHADEINGIVKARDRNKVLISEAYMVTFHPQWLKVRKLLQSGAIGDLRHVQAVFTYNNLDPKNMRNIKDYGGGALPDIGVYPTVTTRFATGKEPHNVSASVYYDKKFGTDCYSTSQLDFGSFDMTMYVSTQLALRQKITFHGNKGWIELSAPFNAGLYDDDLITMSNVDHTEMKQFRFAGVDHYKLQVEAFAREVTGQTQPDGIEVFSLENSIKNQKVIDAIYRAGKSELSEKI